MLARNKIGICDVHCSGSFKIGKTKKMKPMAIADDLFPLFKKRMKNKNNLSSNIINAEKLLEIEIEEVDFVEIEEGFEDEDGIFEFSKGKNNKCSDNIIYPTLTQADLDYDWTKHSSKYSVHDIQALQTWLESQKKFIQLNVNKKMSTLIDINVNKKSI